MAKLQITIDDRLNSKIDQFCDDNFMTKSNFFNFSATEFLVSRDVSKAIMELNVSLKRVADSNQIDEQTRTELEAFQKTCDLLFSRK